MRFAAVGMISHVGLFSHDLFYWGSKEYCPGKTNFGDFLSKVIVEAVSGEKIRQSNLKGSGPCLLAVGSILHYARDHDVIWGSGYRCDPAGENRHAALDVRAVRGPRSRECLLEKGISCPKVYGDPALLLSRLFPHFKRKPMPEIQYVLIPNIGELAIFQSLGYANIVEPHLHWTEIVEKICNSSLVISGSLHGIIVAESFGVPARMLRMTETEPLFKYQDYYEATGRPDFRYAQSVREAIELGGESPPIIDLDRLLDAFPHDYFRKKV